MDSDFDKALIKMSRLQKKLQILESMVEDRTREAYLEEERAASLIDLHQEAMRAGEVDRLINRALDILLGRDFLQIENAGAVFLVEEKSAELVLKAHRNLAPELLDLCTRVPFGRCLCGLAAAECRTFYAANIDERHSIRFDGMRPHGHYCVPIMTGKKPRGVITLYLPANMQKSDEEIAFLGAAADIIAGGLQRLFYEDELEKYQSSLENMVQEQTRELRQTNVQLRQEISDKEKAEESLREAEQKYRSIFENAVDGIFQSTLDGVLLNCNAAFAGFLGYETPAAAIAALDDIARQIYVVPAQRQDLLDLLHKGPVSGFDVQLNRLDGGIIWVTMNVRQAYDRKNDTYFLEGIIQDITLRKTAEDALAAEKERLAVTLASIGDGVITTDTDGRVVLLNRIAEKLTGWTREQAVGKPLSEVFHIINERTLERCENPVEKVLQSGKIIGLANHTALIALDGTERSIADSGAPIRDKSNRIIGIVLVFRDVTEENRMEAELLKIKKLESVGVLAGGIAHDFNNILAAILGNINLASQLTPKENRVHKLLRQAEKASLRARDLTRQLLTFSRGGHPVKKTASIGDIIKESADFILRGSNVACQYSIPDDLWLVDIDTSQMSQVIQNIIINADQAMPEGGVVTVLCDNVQSSAENMLPVSDGAYVRVTISDSGAGIPADILDKVFDPYFTTKQQGNGLGLAITHSIISKHAGHISVQSIPNKGTSFTILLPAASALATETAILTDEHISGSGRLLLMDDEEIVRDVASSMLSHLGYEVLSAENGEEAIVLYQQALDAGSPIDAVIMDLTIPGGMGGLETLKKLTEIYPDVKALVSSGYSNDPVMSNFAEYGFAGSVQKPYRLDELALAVHRVLHGD
ncbi:MAG: PAS domain S-box protein [Proteobacteria bacterium]|nr:PAS domain S-box protein [Pseudomonadota bacterium]MBU1708405.1 PAS domain S-box protein [Pseudomonadota bacterium]